MYCPNCGSQNQDVKFCTRCGTNLGTVTDALAGKTTGASSIDERLLKVIKDYSKGRRNAITGAVLIPAGLFVMSLLIWVGLPPVASFFIVCWMFFWGASALADGLGKWIAASGEMKTLKDIAGPKSLPGSSEEQAGVQVPPSFLTGPVEYPGSVTDQTTRQLEQKGFPRITKEQSERTN
ncbi:MAG TPA: hypothetical protein VIG62_03140 [Blastocatellia bacterium]|jgi:hypothetical protein